MTTFAGSYFPASYFPPGWSSGTVETDPGALRASVSGSALAAGSITARGYLFGAIAASASVQAFITQATGEIVATLTGSASVTATLTDGNAVSQPPVLGGGGGGGLWRVVTPSVPLSSLRMSRKVPILAALNGRSSVAATATAEARLAAQISGSAFVAADLDGVDMVGPHNAIALLLAA